MRRRARGLASAAVAAVLAASGPADAHSGPPYPVVSNQVSGAYRISVWTDPDATDDRTAAGRFWVTIAPARDGALPSDTRAHLAIRAADRDAAGVEAQAAPIEGDVARQYAALLMDHEGPFEVHVTVNGGLGPAVVDTSVQATYDLRPPFPLLALYLLPFVLAGFLWTKRLLRRRAAQKPRTEQQRRT